MRAVRGSFGGHLSEDVLEPGLLVRFAFGAVETTEDAVEEEAVEPPFQLDVGEAGCVQGQHVAFGEAQGAELVLVDQLGEEVLQGRARERLGTVDEPAGATASRAAFDDGTRLCFGSTQNGLLRRGQGSHSSALTGARPGP